MDDTIDRKAAEFSRQAESYAIALVVRAESPTSAKPGARGLVTSTGAITGWIGGGCAQPIVIEEARRAIREGSPRLVRITPEAGRAEVNGLVTHEMVCHSGGTLDIFIEPVLPAPQMVILGRSPVARTLAWLAAGLGYAVAVFGKGALREEFPNAKQVEPSLDLSALKHPERSFVVISTQGEDDEGGMVEALRLNAPYVAFVASPKKWKAVSTFLVGQGFSKADLARVKVPAGIEIHAHDPEEIALSIMAQVVAERRGGALGAIPSTANEQVASPDRELVRAIDPVCNMTVEIATAKYLSEHRGQKAYFCCAGCKENFDRTPEKFTRLQAAP